MIKSLNTKNLLGGLLLGVLASGSAVAADGNLRIGIEAAYPPFSFKTPEGEPGRLRLRHRQCAVRADAGEVPVDRAGVRRPDPLAESPQDRRRAVFHHHHRGTPALGGLHPQVLLHPGPPGDEEGAQLDDSFSQLAGKRIGVQRGATADRFASAVLAKAGAEVVRYTSQDEIYLDLVAGRLDATFADSIPLQTGFLDTPRGKGYAFVGPEFKDPKHFGEGAGIAVRKGDAELLGKLNAAIDAIRADGTYKRIESKYFKTDIYGD